MSPIDLEIEIAAPTTRVFELAADIPNVPKVQPEIVRIEMLTPGPVAKGTRWRETRRMGSREVTVEIAMTDFRPGAGYACTCQTMGVLYSTHFTFEAAGPGRTRVVMSTQRTPQGFWSGLLSRALTGVMRKGLMSDLTALRRAAESTPA